MLRIVRIRVVHGVQGVVRVYVGIGESRVEGDADADLAEVDRPLFVRADRTGRRKLEIDTLALAGGRVRHGQHARARRIVVIRDGEVGGTDIRFELDLGEARRRREADPAGARVELGGRQTGRAS